MTFGFPKPKPRVLDKREAAKEKAANCQNCGATFIVSKPSQLAKRKVCGTACWYALVKKRRPVKACPQCGQRFAVHTPTNLTCSKECGYLYRKAKKRKPRTCRQCHQSYFPVMASLAQSKFCSLKCRIAFKSEHRPAFVSVVCQECGCGFRRTDAAVKRVSRSFCSRACWSKANRGAGSVLYRGNADPNRGGDWRRLAESIRKRDGYTCQRCTRTQEENGQKLSVDHIRPWRSFTDKAEANQPRNLISLCRKCHSLKTVTYERAWLKGDCIGMYQYETNVALPSGVREAAAQVEARKS